MDDEPVKLAGPVAQPVARDVHLVPALREAPGPAEEDDRAPVADPEQAQGFLGHAGGVYPRPARPSMT